MKPLPTALICLACSFAAAALAYVLFDANHKPLPAAQAPEDAAATARIGQLETDVSSLNSKVDELLKLRAEPAPLRPVADKPDATPGTTEVQPKAEGDTAKLDALAERLAEIESGEAAAREMRAKAILDLHSDDEDKQEDAARLLGQLAVGGDKAAKQALRDAMKSEDATVREWAIEALNDSGLVEFLPDLKALMNDPEPDVREEVTQTLASMPADQAGPLLVSMLTDAEPDVLLGAIEVLGDLEYKAAIADLLPLTRHSNEEIAIEAAVAMQRCGDPSAAETWVPTLGARLASADVEERRRAIRYLRSIGLESARVYFEQALKDSDQRVRRDAERALRDLNE